MRKYRDGRQSTSSVCASIVTADRVRDTTGWCTLTGDGVREDEGWCTVAGERVHDITAEILRQPTEYFRNLQKNQDGRQSMQGDRMEYYNGR